MNRVVIRILCLVATFTVGVSVFLFLSLLRSDRGHIPAAVIVDDAQPIPPLTFPESSPDSPIRKIDFRNFTYPSHVVREAGGFKVRNGELLPKRKDSFGRPLDTWLVLSDVTYGDVTGDGEEEAIVVLCWVTGGSAMPDFVYIYGLRKEKPRLLWVFETGDRADGGYKDVFAEDGKLIIELLGKDKIIGTDLYKDDGTTNGLCCPTHFTRTKYEWANNRFRKQGKSEVLPLEKP